jgi:hypothetical protein
MATPGMTAPEVSNTVPATRPDSTCASNAIGRNSASVSKRLFLRAEHISNATHLTNCDSVISPPLLPNATESTPGRMLRYHKAAYVHVMSRIVLRQFFLTRFYQNVFRFHIVT